MKSVSFEKSVFTAGLLSRAASSETADVCAICTGENKVSGIVGENSGYLISQRDFLTGTISMFESDCDGEMKRHDDLSYSEKCVLRLHDGEKVSEATACHPACSNETSTEAKSA